MLTQCVSAAAAGREWQLSVITDMFLLAAPPKGSSAHSCIPLNFMETQTWRQFSSCHDTFQI